MTGDIHNLSKIEFNTDVTETFETADDTAKYIMDYVLDNYEEASFVGDSEIVNAVLNSLVEICDYGSLEANINVNDTGNLYGLSLDEDMNIYVACLGNAKIGYALDFDGHVFADGGSTPLSYLTKLFELEVEFDTIELEEFIDTFEPLYKADYAEGNEYNIDSSSKIAVRTPEELIIFYS